jgi:hypothetical protein
MTVPPPAPPVKGARLVGRLAMVAVVSIGALSLLGRAGDPARAPRHADVVDSLEVLDPDDRGFALWLAERLHDDGEAVAAGVCDPELMNDYAWDLLSKRPGDRPVAEEALRVARRSVALSEKAFDSDRAARLDTLAWALAETGDLADARSTEQRAVDCLPDVPGNTRLRDGLVEKLRRYGG